jgi:hypothetical protein
MPEASAQPSFVDWLQDFPVFQGPGGELCWFQRLDFPFLEWLSLAVKDDFLVRGFKRFLR